MLQEDQTLAARREGIKDGMLNKKKFQALEELLNKSEMYTQFLADQMKEIEALTEREAQQLAAQANAAAEEEEAVTKKKGRGAKRGRGKAALAKEEEQAAKKGKSSLTPTQVCMESAWA